MSIYDTIRLGSLYADGIPIFGGGTLPYEGRPYYHYQQGQHLEIGDAMAGYELEWLPVGNILMGTRVICNNISGSDLNKLGFMKGREVTINGARYLCRVPSVPNLVLDSDTPNEFAQAYDKYGNDQEIWHWKNIGSIARDPAIKGTDAYAAIGFSSPNYEIAVSVSRKRQNDLGFRPVLVSLNVTKPWQHIIGKLVTVITPSDAVHGELIDVTDYDVVVKLDAGEQQFKGMGQWMAECDAESFLVAVNKESILHLCPRDSG